MQGENEKYHIEGEKTKIKMKFCAISSDLKNTHFASLVLFFLIQRLRSRHICYSSVGHAELRNIPHPRYARRPCCLYHARVASYICYSTVGHAELRNIPHPRYARQLCCLYHDSFAVYITTALLSISRQLCCLHHDSFAVYITTALLSISRRLCRLYHAPTGSIYSSRSHSGHIPITSSSLCPS